MVAVRAPVASVRVVAWAWSETRRLGEALRYQGMDAIDGIRPSPPVPSSHRPAVTAVLRRAGATCLVGSAVLQRWDADRDRVRLLVVGVAREAEGGIAAHAWLDGDLDGDGDDFVELHRRLPGRALTGWRRWHRPGSAARAISSKRAFLKKRRGRRWPGCRIRRRRARSFASAA